MPRAQRIEYEGAIYHVINRGDRREDIFFDDGDRRMFLKTLDETCAKTRWEVHAYCLMDNHFHLVIETPIPSLVAGMKWMLGTYTQRFNARHRLHGHLFAGRYKALHVDGSGDFYLRTVADYVHLNPFRAGILDDDRPLASFQWSSYPDYLKQPRDRSTWLRVDRVMGDHGIQRDDAGGRREFGRGMERRRFEAIDDETYARIRRGWRLGGEDFSARLRRLLVPAKPDCHAPEDVRESMLARAERILEEELAKDALTRDSLLKLPKGAPIKVRAAERIRGSTTLTLKEVAELLHAGHWRSLANALVKRRKAM
ncbi:MAG: transposase [Chthoniobacterales bacterium]